MGNQIVGNDGSVFGGVFRSFKKGKLMERGEDGVIF